MISSLDRALGILGGPLEVRIMREAWTGAVPESFIVRDMLNRMPDLAYTTVMTILNRLADKGLLDMQRTGRRQPNRYRVHWSPDEFLAESSRRSAEKFIHLYGDAALAEFATRLEALSDEQVKRLRELGKR